MALGHRYSSVVDVCKQTLLATFTSFNRVETKDKDNKFLNGVFAPVHEEITAKECEVVGTLPEVVCGEFVRNGPNPRFMPKGGYHWFDGLGMVSEQCARSKGTPVCMHALKCVQIARVDLSASGVRQHLSAFDEVV